MSHLEDLVDELQHILAEVEKNNLQKALSRLDHVLHSFEEHQIRAHLRAPRNQPPDNVVPLRKQPALRPRTVGRRRASA